MTKKHKLIYCVVPKAACTTWKTILKEATGNPKASDVNPHDLDSLRNVLQLPMMSHLNVTDIRSKLLSPDYFKFLVVRHPIERLISAFRDKVAHGNYKPLTYKYMTKHIRRHKSSFTKQPTNSSHITWTEFVTFLVNEQGDDIRSVYNVHANDIHWRRQVDLCRPCCIPYNHVIKMETMEHDASPVLEILKNSREHMHRRELPTLNRAAKTAKKNTILKEFQELPPSIKTRLIERYMDDFKLFGYNVTDQGTSLCKISGILEPCC